MSNRPDFTTTMSLDCTRQEAFEAINDVRGWWSENVEGVTDRLHGEFTFHYKDVHFSRHRVVELCAGTRVVWKTMEARLNFVDDPGEWDGSDICFDITERAGKTHIRFTHVGLVPQLECYDACSNAWRYYFRDSLRTLITTGQGEPDEKHEAGG